MHLSTWQACKSDVQPTKRNLLFFYIIIFFIFFLCTRVPGKGVIFGFSTKSANFRWIIGAGVGFVEISGVDIYVGLDLKCWGAPPLQQSD